MEIVWPCCGITVDVRVSRRYEFPRTLQVFMEIQKFSSYSSPSLHLFATLENSTLRFFHLVLSLQVSLYSSNLVDSVPSSVPALFDAIGLCTVEERVAHCKTRFNVGVDFATILSPPFSSCSPFRHCFRAAGQA